MIRAMIVDDSEKVCAVWNDLLSRINGIQVVGIYSQASTAQQAIDRLKPDLILLDIELGAESGSQVLRHAVTVKPDTKVIVVTNHADKVFKKHYLNAGAYAFFDKSHESHKLRGTLVNLADAANSRLMMSGHHA